MCPILFIPMAKIQIQPYNDYFNDNSLRLSSQHPTTSYLNSDMK